jgi:hypothetical protein
MKKVPRGTFAIPKLGSDPNYFACTQNNSVETHSCEMILQALSFKP